MSKHRASRSAVAVPALSGADAFRVRSSVPTMEPYIAPVAAAPAPIVTFDAVPAQPAPVQYVNTFAGRHVPAVAEPRPGLAARLNRTVVLGVTLLAAVVAAVVVYL